MPRVEEPSQPGLLDTAAEAFQGEDVGWANFDEIDDVAAAEAGGDLSEMELSDLVMMFKTIRVFKSSLNGIRPGT